MPRLDDMRKLKMFSWAGSNDELELWKANGFHPVALAATDIQMGLKTGLIDVIPTTPLYALWNQCFTLAKYMTDVKWAPLVGATVVSKAVWDKIPEGQRTQMLQAARESGQQLRSGIRDMGDKADGRHDEWVARQENGQADDRPRGRRYRRGLAQTDRGRLPHNARQDHSRRSVRRGTPPARGISRQKGRQVKLVRAFLVSEEALAVAAMSVMALLPVAELVARYTGLNGVPGSTVFVQHLTLWVAFLGAALAAASDRLLALSANTFCRLSGPRRCACSAPG
ncbi:MAG: TRAP transporter substrate-binding protein DctP [Ignavibacteriota bacterium]